MTTLDQIVSKVRQQLLGFTLNQESITELTSPMTASDTTFMVDVGTVTALARGLVQIDDELILVRSYDDTSGAVTVMGGANGRGAENTTPAAHNVSALVTSNPAFPRASIKDAISRSIETLYPDLVAFGVVDFPFNAAQVEYPLPADAEGVWYVVGRWVGPEMVSAPMPNWRVNPRAYAGDFPTGKSIQIFDPVTPGQNVRVVYTKTPTLLAADSDDFTLTGYEDSVHDLVVWDSCKRLLPGLLSARLQQQAVEATERAALVSSRDIASAVQMYASLYAEGLEREKARQYADTPTYVTFQGS
ncbi:phage adaptor protein [Streptomyces tsukubensis]|uniref:phage adaptor protein n=1 Tax=Streptomyces tsukubensis TaxID=83656 RepID=UPI00344E164C